MPELAEILRRHLGDLEASFDGRIPRDVWKVVLDLVRCRTPALGGSLYACDDAECGALDYADHSCRNRHCPKCHGNQTREWLEKLHSILLPCPYLLVTFTLPDRLRDLARREPRIVYDLMMRLAARCVVDVARDSQSIGGTPGVAFHARCPSSFHRVCHRGEPRKAEGAVALGLVGSDPLSASAWMPRATF